MWTALGLGNGLSEPATLALEDFGAQSRDKGVVPVKRAVISLDHLHCHKDGETLGGGEPYLLVAFFKVDGDTDFIGVHEETIDGIQIRKVAIKGPCTFRSTFGTHGNLGDSTVNDGDNVPMPPELGRFEFKLKPIAFPDAPDLGLVGGFCGVVVALVEQNSTSDDAADKGDRAFNRTLMQLINDILPTLEQDVPDPLPPGKLEELKDEVADRIKDAVISGEFSSIIGIPRLLNADVLVGADVFTADRSREIHARFQRIQTVHPVPPPGNFPPLPDQQILKQDYELFGSITVEVTDG